MERIEIGLNAFDRETFNRCCPEKPLIIYRPKCAVPAGLVVQVDLWTERSPGRIEYELLQKHFLTAGENQKMLSVVTCAHCKKNITTKWDKEISNSERR